jgi:hypothetical protein
LAALSVLSLSVSLTAHADVQLNRWTSPIMLVADTQHNAEHTAIGAPFSAHLADTYCVDGACLPKGTMFHGHVDTMTESRRMYRPGKIEVYFDEIEYPNGTKMSLINTNDTKGDHISSRARMFKYRHPKAVVFRRDLIQTMPVFIAGAATALSLGIATPLESAVIPISFGSRLVVSEAQEGIMAAHDPGDQSFWGGALRGAMRAAIVPYAIYNASYLSPEAMIDPGQVIKYKPRRELAKRMYMPQL